MHRQDIEPDEYDYLSYDIGEIMSVVNLNSSSTKTTVATHSGGYHCDEVLAIALLDMGGVVKDYTIVRTRDEGIIFGVDIIVDVGGVYDPSRMMFDHHQDKELLGACHLVAEYVFSLEGIPLHYELFDIARYVGTHDVGGDKEALKEKMTAKIVELSELLIKFVQESQTAGRYFDDVLKDVIEVLRDRSVLGSIRYIETLLEPIVAHNRSERYKDIDIIRECISDNKDRGITEMVCFKSFKRNWREAINTTDTPDIYYAVWFDEIQNNYCINVVAKKGDPQKWDPSLNLNELKGLIDDEHIVFIHNSGFTARVTSLEGIFCDEVEDFFAEEFAEKEQTINLIGSNDDRVEHYVQYVIDNNLRVIDSWDKGATHQWQDAVKYNKFASGSKDAIIAINNSKEYKKIHAIRAYLRLLENDVSSINKLIDENHKRVTEIVLERTNEFGFCSFWDANHEITEDILTKVIEENWEVKAITFGEEIALVKTPNGIQKYVFDGCKYNYEWEYDTSLTKKYIEFKIDILSMIVDLDNPIVFRERVGYKIGGKYYFIDIASMKKADSDFVLNDYVGNLKEAYKGKDYIVVDMYVKDIHKIITKESGFKLIVMDGEFISVRDGVNSIPEYEIKVNYKSDMEERGDMIAISEALASMPIYKDIIEERTTVVYIGSLAYVPLSLVLKFKLENQKARLISNDHLGYKFEMLV